MNTHINIDDFNKIALSNKAVCFYLSTPECNVCRILKPKIVTMFETLFPQMEFYYINLAEAKEISGQLSVFSVPTILVYFEGRELIRVSRIVNLNELQNQIERYYKIIF